MSELHRVLRRHERRASADDAEAAAITSYAPSSSAKEERKSRAKAEQESDHGKGVGDKKEYEEREESDEDDEEPPFCLGCSGSLRLLSESGARALRSALLGAAARAAAGVEAETTTTTITITEAEIAVAEAATAPVTFGAMAEDGASLQAVVPSPQVSPLAPPPPSLPSRLLLPSTAALQPSSAGASSSSCSFPSVVLPAFVRALAWDPAVLEVASAVAQRSLAPHASRRLQARARLDDDYNEEMAANDDGDGGAARSSMERGVMVARRISEFDSSTRQISGRRHHDAMVCGGRSRYMLWSYRR